MSAATHTSTAPDLVSLLLSYWWLALIFGGAALLSLFTVEFFMQHTVRPETALYLCAAGSLLVAAVALAGLAPRR